MFCGSSSCSCVTSVPNLRGRPKKKPFQYRKYAHDHVYGGHESDEESCESYATHASSSRSSPAKPRSPKNSPNKPLSAPNLPASKAVGKKKAKEIA